VSISSGLQIVPRRAFDVRDISFGLSEPMYIGVSLDCLRLALVVNHHVG
jgi:hypothetical protein